MYNLVFGDSRQHIATLADHSVDLLLTDPPYNLGTYSTGNIKMSWRKDFNNDIAAWDQKPFSPEDWKAQFVRVLKPTGNIFIFCSYNQIGLWHAALDPLFDTFQFMVWKKSNPPPKLFRAGFLNSCELIVCAWNKKHTWHFTKQSEMHNFIQTGICQGNERVQGFPTQKPLKVLRRIVELASNPGDLVYDPFMGVASSGVAALALGRNFLGVESDPAVCALAVERMRLHTESVIKKLVLQH